jgi:hypothetical protein
MFCTVHQNYYGDNNKGKEILVLHVERIPVLIENFQQKGHLQDLGIDGRIKLTGMF